MLVYRQKDQMRACLDAVTSDQPHMQKDPGNPEFTPILSFDGDSSDEEMKLFEFIDDTIDRRSVRLLAITSKVLCGADIQVPFHRVYVHCGHGTGPTSREVFQVLGRCRNCVSGVYMCYLSGHLRQKSPRWQ